MPTALDRVPTMKFDGKLIVNDRSETIRVIPSGDGVILLGSFLADRVLGAGEARVTADLELSRYNAAALILSLADALGMPVELGPAR